MDRLEIEAREAGIRRIWLLTDGAQRFYEGRGHQAGREEIPAALQAFVEPVKRTIVMVGEP